MLVAPNPGTAGSLVPTTANIDPAAFDTAQYWPYAERSPRPTTTHHDGGPPTPVETTEPRNRHIPADPDWPLPTGPVPARRPDASTIEGLFILAGQIDWLATNDPARLARLARELIARQIDTIDETQAAA